MAASEHQIQRSAVVAGRLLEAFFFAPIGASAKLVVDAPAALARARQELSNARFIGELVIGQGTAQLKQRLASPGVEQAVESTSQPVVESAAVEPDPVGELVDDAVDHVEADALGIPDYDSQPAIDIVGLLDTLTAAELSAVETYERGHRRRRTVLGKIAQLSGDA